MASELPSTEQRTHELKVWPEFFAALADGSKTFEARKDDRGFRVGDRLYLNEWIPHEGGGGEYTSGQLCKVVTYILAGPAFGVERGWVVMGLADPEPDEFAKSLSGEPSAEHGRYLAGHTESSLAVIAGALKVESVTKHHSNGVWIKPAPRNGVEQVPYWATDAELAYKLAQALHSSGEPAESRPIITVNGDGECTKVEFNGAEIWKPQKPSAPGLRKALAEADERIATLERLSIRERQALIDWHREQAVSLGGQGYAEGEARHLERAAQLQLRPSWMCRLGVTCQHPESPRNAAGECTGCTPETKPVTEPSAKLPVFGLPQREIAAGDICAVCGRTWERFKGGDSIWHSCCPPTKGAGHAE